jgi:FkbM family methyltransferase
VNEPTSAARTAQRVARLLRYVPPRAPGKLRAARWLLGGAARARDVEVEDWEGNVFCVPNLREPMAMHLLANGVYEAETHAAIRQRLKGDAIFVDVGASIGLFTVPAARQAEVVAVEASPRWFGYLEGNVRRNGVERAQLVQAVAGERDGDTAHFFEAPEEKFGMGSRAPQFGGVSVPVVTRTVDGLLTPAQAARVRVIKLDVEGYEAHALKGAQGLLTRDEPPAVVFEFAAWAEARAGEVGAAQRMLKELGFRIWRLEDRRRGRAPLDKVLCEGDAMLVAER